MPIVKTLTLEQVLAFQLLVVQKYGGSAGVRDMGRLQSAIASQNQIVFGAELHGTVFLKSAAVGRGIIGDHPFVDANKRTALLAMLVLIEQNGYCFSAQAGELENFAVQIAVERLDVTQIANWLAAHTEK